MIETIEWKKPRKGGWPFDHPAAYEQAKAMLLAGVPCPTISRETKAPKTTLQGMKAKLTKSRNERIERQMIANAKVPASLMMWVTA